MKFLTVFFSIFLVIAILARVLCGYYVYAVPWFADTLKPLTYICVGAGVVTLGLIVSIIIRSFKK